MWKLLKYLSLTVFILALLAVTALAYLWTTREPDECFIPDQYSLLSSKDTNGDAYQLYYVVAGWADKLEFLTLYRGDLVYDKCGGVSSEALDNVDIDRGPEGAANQAPTKIIIEGERIRIEYAPLSETMTPVSELPVEWRRPSKNAENL
ncbi:hypothetical protein O5O45_27970 [Hahella aquimaris]|uniref:hypothetical protein n=1 Tax=Hahella sp. HNIBRBA332 TaxID=3015983 RepID=UPI00273B008F|nr:hypothetical protein [Hahella sp. HNIBRBA332]WLQ13569.1 hypothetical protein O5O45_27970 [Hahella sp. HNIBRBA332]